MLSGFCSFREVLRDVNRCLRAMERYELEREKYFVGLRLERREAGSVLGGRRTYHCCEVPHASVA